MVPAEYFLALPFDIIFTILLRLPAEVLVRFMLVCRQWRALIKDVDFIFEHLQFSASTGYNYILGGLERNRSGQSLKLLLYKNPDIVLERKIQLFDCHPDTHMQTHSSKGLVLVTDTKYDRGCPLFLYNPFIQKSKPITSTSINIRNHSKKVDHYVIGFGYHSQAKVYKIVRIAYFQVKDDPEEVELEVYSLSTDSWRRLDGRTFSWYVSGGFGPFSMGVLVNDRLHWMAIPKQNLDQFLTLVFDLKTEVFQTIDLPNYEVVANRYSMDIVAYKDKLSSMMVYFNGQRECCSLWVMMEYGVSNSWCWLFEIVMDDYVARPITFTKHDELIFEVKDGNVGVFNVFTHERQYIEFEGEMLDFFPLTNSLTLL